MGMAASQAQLLCITARIHDVEYQAQSIQNAKLQLATQEDQAYREYNEALDSTTLAIQVLTPDGEKSLVAANFNNLCSTNRLMGADGSFYAIRNQRGQLLVEDEIEEAYYNFKQEYPTLNDPYAFAMYMLNEDVTEQNISKELIQNAENKAYENNKDQNDELSRLHKALTDYTGSDDVYDTSKIEKEEDLEKYKNTLAQYKRVLYSNYLPEIMTDATLIETTEEDINQDLYNYYVSIYNQIQQCGGCVSISDYNGIEGDAANNGEWLQAMIQSGRFYIETIDTNRKTGAVTLNTTTIASDSSLRYTPTTDIDKRALAKAEAEYEHKLKIINKKDQQFDLELSKLDTHRQALDKQYENLKTVIKENIERSFKIFS